MIPKKQFLAVSIITILVTGGVAATRHRQYEFKNLQILPKDISKEKLDSIMESYNKALGEKCDFCHVPVPGFTDSLNYASDDEPMKKEARDMMRMTIMINKTYFNFKEGVQPEFLNRVRCMTCHQGQAIPEEGKED
jgi:hypothetical protein